MKKWISIIFCCCLWAPWCVNASASYTFESQKEERKFDNVVKEFRCLTCPNQNISDSEAPIAKAMREEIYKRLKQGDSVESIRAYLIANYGDYVLYRPQLRKQTAPLWLGPLVMVVAGVALWFTFVNPQKMTKI